MMLALLLALLAAAAQARPAMEMTLDVDATDAPMRILHAKASMPARRASGDDLLTSIAAARAK